MNNDQSEYDELTFGQTIAKARKKKELSLRELSFKILREDGQGPISPQYLNDIEHDRRSPSSDHMVQQLASFLGVDINLLYFRAGRLPAEMRSLAGSAHAVHNVMVAARRNVKG